MKCNIEEVVDVVDRLNEIISPNGDFDNFPLGLVFAMSYTSEISIITYGEIWMWDSQEEEREFNEEKNEYEDLYTFIWKKFTKYVNELNNIVAKTNFKN